MRPGVAYAAAEKAQKKDEDSKNEAKRRLDALKPKSNINVVQD
jgi:hypothetical protein